MKKGKKDEKQKKWKKGEKQLHKVMKFLFFVQKETSAVLRVPTEVNRRGILNIEKVPSEDQRYFSLSQNAAVQKYIFPIQGKLM